MTSRRDFDNWWCTINSIVHEMSGGLTVDQIETPTATFIDWRRLHASGYPPAEAYLIFASMDNTIAMLNDEVGEPEPVEQAYTIALN